MAFYLRNLEIIIDEDTTRFPKKTYENIVADKYVKLGYIVKKNNGFPAGIPDFSMYNKKGVLEFMLEVKSPNDMFRLKQFLFIKNNPNIKFFLYKFIKDGPYSNEYYEKHNISHLSNLNKETLRFLKESGRNVFY